MKKVLHLWKPILLHQSMDPLNHMLHRLWKNSDTARVARPQITFTPDNLLLMSPLLILEL